MDAIKVWIEEHVVLFFAVTLAISAILLVLGTLGAWRTGRRLKRRPRPVAGFVVALICLASGLGGVVLFSNGLRAALPVARAQSAMLGQPAPALEFAYLEDERPGGLEDFRGQVVLVNIWATWCPPCRHEMPDLDRLQRTYAERGLVVLNLSDERPAAVAKYLDEEPMSTVHGIVRPIPWPEFGRPTSYIVDREGVVRRAITGSRDYAGFEREILAHL